MKVIQNTRQLAMVDYERSNYPPFTGPDPLGIPTSWVKGVYWLEFDGDTVVTTPEPNLGGFLDALEATTEDVLYPFVMHEVKSEQMTLKLNSIGLNLYRHYSKNSNLKEVMEDLKLFNDTVVPVEILDMDGDVQLSILTFKNSQGRNSVLTTDKIYQQVWINTELRIQAEPINEPTPAHYERRYKVRLFTDNTDILSIKRDRTESTLISLPGSIMDTLDAMKVLDAIESDEIVVVATVVDPFPEEAYLAKIKMNDMSIELVDTISTDMIDPIYGLRDCIEIQVSKDDKGNYEFSTAFMIQKDPFYGGIEGEAKDAEGIKTAIESRLIDMATDFVEKASEADSSLGRLHKSQEEKRALAAFKDFEETQELYETKRTKSTGCISL